MLRSANKLSTNVDLYEEQQNKSRSCPTRGVDQNLSFCLGISGASEGVSVCRLEKVPEVKDLLKEGLGTVLKM